MNDFSKEELCKLMRAILWVDHDHDKQLANKIQSMMDNYDAKVIKAWHCEKCGHVQ